MLKDVFESEIADGIKYETLTMAVELSNFNTQYPDIRVRGMWEDDCIQFARLLCELRATQDNLDLQELGDSMDLPKHRIDELFERADKVFEKYKPKNFKKED